MWNIFEINEREANLKAVVIVCSHLLQVILATPRLTGSLWTWTRWATSSLVKCLVICWRLVCCHSLWWAYGFGFSWLFFSWLCFSWSYFVLFLVHAQGALPVVATCSWRCVWVSWSYRLIDFYDLYIITLMGLSGGRGRFPFYFYFIPPLCPYQNTF